VPAINLAEDQFRCERLFFRPNPASAHDLDQGRPVATGVSIFRSIQEGNGKIMPAQNAEIAAIFDQTADWPRAKASRLPFPPMRE
jgi:hypothetical protein